MYYFIFLSLAALGLHCCKGFSLVVALQFLAAAASPVTEHRLSDTQASVVAACGKLGFCFFNNFPSFSKFSIKQSFSSSTVLLL